MDSVTSYTLAITVTQPISSGTLYAQVLPAAHPTTTVPNHSPVVAMNLVPDTDTFTQTIDLSYPIANGFVRLWISDTLPLRETITEFFFSGNWGFGASKHSWGPNSHRYGWGVSQ